VLEGFGVPSPAMVKGLLDATRVGWRCGVDGNKVERWMEFGSGMENTRSLSSPHETPSGHMD